MDAEMKQTPQTSASQSSDGRKPKKKLSWFWILVIALFAIGVLGAAIIPQVMEEESSAPSLDLPAATRTETDGGWGNVELPAVKPTESDSATSGFVPAEEPAVTVAPAPAPEPEPEPQVPEAAIDTENVGRPTAEDFTWLSGVLNGGLPSGATLLSDGASVSGMWKGYLMFVEDGQIVVQQLLNAEIMAGDRAVTVILDWYQVNYGDGFHEEQGVTASTYDGAIDQGTVTCYGMSGNLELTSFYQLEGKQYAVGTYMVPSGEVAYVGLVRP